MLSWGSEPSEHLLRFATALQNAQEVVREQRTRLLASEDYVGARSLLDALRDLARASYSAAVAAELAAIPREERTCRVCRLAFQPRSSEHRYCSEPCATKAHRLQDKLSAARRAKARPPLSFYDQWAKDRRATQAVPASRACAQCNKPFKPKHLQRRYCSPECSRAKHREVASRTMQRYRARRRELSAPDFLPPTSLT